MTWPGRFLEVPPFMSAKGKHLKFIEKNAVWVKNAPFSLFIPSPPNAVCEFEADAEDQIYGS